MYYYNHLAKVGQTAKKGKTLIFHWRGGYLTREVLTGLFQIFEEEAVKKEEQAVRITFKRTVTINGNTGDDK